MDLLQSFYSKIRKNLIGFVLLLTLLYFYSNKLVAQPSFHFYSRQEYIELYKDEAVRQMYLHNIPASITLAQALLESNDGNSPLAKFANNHFGIKCHREWDGNTYTYDDDLKNECFRKYTNPMESYEDHSYFLKSRRWYSSLFGLPVTDYKSWAYGLKKAGYATEPKYAEMLLEIIEKNELFKFDRLYTMPGNSPSLNLTSNNNQLFYVPEKAVVKLNNNLRCVEVKDDETIEWIAADFKIPLEKLLRYNDLKHDTLVKVGDLVYLEPKKHYTNTDFYLVKEGDTMFGISQRFGVRLSKLYYYNSLPEGTDPIPGQMLFLSYKKK